ncbi:MAG: type II toxin-antitoxin system VapC family toxin, partial [Burkholderiales bacterium]|nr:type II toxin-antitoxin system VapC family toxin [Anaerolineae bacterium]
MKISSSLAAVQRLYIETSPFIYYVENHPIYSDKMDNIFDGINARQIEVLSSVITLSETLTKPLKTGDKVVEQAYRALFQQTHYITLLPINISVAERTADLRARYNLKTPDALHLAAALDSGCNAFLTNDLALKRVTEIHVLALDEMDLDI